MPADRVRRSVEPSTRFRSGYALLAVGLLLTFGAAGVLVLTDDQRWLRLGIIAALWSALVGAFVAAKYRGQVLERDDRAADRQAVYELELEREIAARREYELQVEAEIRNEVEERSRQDLAALQDEVRALRQALGTLMGGEVLVERYALHAQSTRMRPLAERQASVKRLDPGAAKPAQSEPVTERIERVREVRPVEVDVTPRARPRPTPPLPRRSENAERPAWPPREEPASTPAERSVRMARPGRPPPRPEPARPVRAEPPVPPPHPAEVSDRWFIPGALQPEPARAEPPASGIEERLDLDWTPPWERGDRHIDPLERPVVPPDPPPATGGRRHRAEPLPDPVPELLPEPGRRHARQEDTGGGRRRRAGDEASWQELAAWDPVVKATRMAPRSHGHAREEGGHRSESSSGSHATGHSVADLLAAHGATSPRRRRRRED